MLKKEIQSAISGFLKEGNEIASSTLRLLIAAIISKEKEKRYKISKENPNLNEKELIEKSELSDEEILDVISSEVKKRKEAILAYEKGNRPELSQKEKSEMDILMKYMPEQISEDELKKIVKEAIGKVGAKEIKDMGKIMAEVMPKVKGRTDGSEVNRIAKELLDQ